MNKTSSKISIKNKDDIEVPITNNSNMNIFFNKKTKLLYFQDNFGNEYDLNGFSRGFMGADGEKGDQGDKGDKGDIGPMGPKGDRGFCGKNGDKGEKGDQGETGFSGPKGDRGIRGVAGETGPKGDKGEIGIRGAKGDKGDRGDCGRQGEKGEQGIRGSKGDKGDRGDRGERGPPGTTNISNSNYQEEINKNLFLTDGNSVVIDKNNLNFDIPCDSNNILSINFSETLKGNSDIYNLDSCNNTKITLNEKGIYKITYNICWFVDINSLISKDDDTNKQQNLVKEAKKTIKGGIVCFLYEDDDMIHQSTVHNQGSVFVNSANHTFIINKKSSRSYNNLAIGIHKGYESKENIDISIHQEGTFLQIEALN